MEIGSPTTLRLEDSEGPRGRNVEFAVHSQRGQRGPQIRRFRRSPNAHPYPAMQVFDLATGSLDLHVLSDLVGKQMAVVGHQHDGLDAVIGQHPHASPQMTQHAVDLKPGLGHVVGLAQFVDFLRRNQDQLGVLNAVLDLLGWLGEQVVQLRIEDRHARIFLQERHPILAILDDLATDLQRQFAAAHGHHLGGLVSLRQ